MAVDIQVLFKGRLYADPAAGVSAVIGQLREGPGIAANHLSVELRTWLQGLAAKLVAANSSPWPGGTTPSSVSMRSGALVAALQAGITVQGSALGTLVATWAGNEYMAAHEKGATISARGARYLAIPLPTALNATGEPIHPNPRDWPNTFVGQSKLGNMLIFMRVGSQIVPLYVLKSSVRIPARLGAAKAIESSLPYFVGRALDTVVRSMAAVQ